MEEQVMRSLLTRKSILTGVLLIAGSCLTHAWATEKPNIIVVTGDDIGWSHFGVYNRGMMAVRTPNIDKIANEGALFTDYYAEASCTAGRANFITSQIPLRTGLTTVGQAGSDIGIPAASPTIAAALKDEGYVTGQFGKNHLGDLNKYLPCEHGFDEYFGWLYHLDAMQDPFNPTYPPELKDTIGPRNLVSCTATSKVDKTVQKRWGKIGKQRVTDEGPMPPHPVNGIKYDMTMIDSEVTRRSVDFIDRAVKSKKPFFLWMNPARMHVFTHLSDKYTKTMTPENNWTIQEAGMKEMDDMVGALLKKLDDLGIADNTIIVVTSDNGAEVFSWPDGGMTPFRGTKGMVLEGGFRAPMVMRWPGKIKPGTVFNDIFSGLDFFPTFVAAAGGSKDIAADLKKGKKINGKKYKVHLDGYNQVDFLTGNSKSKRHEIFYFGEAKLGAVRVDDMKFIFLDQPDGWFGPKVTLDWPKMVNLRLDPYERCINFDECPSAMMDWWAHEFWRFVFVQEKVSELAKTFIEFAPQQAPASFNLDAIKAKIKKMRQKARPGHMAN